MIWSQSDIWRRLIEKRPCHPGPGYDRVDFLCSTRLRLSRALSCDFPFFFFLSADDLRCVTKVTITLKSSSARSTLGEQCSSLTSETERSHTHPEFCNLNFYLGVLLDTLLWLMTSWLLPALKWTKIFSSNGFQTVLNNGPIWSFSAVLAAFQGLISALSSPRYQPQNPPVQFEGWGQSGGSSASYTGEQNRDSIRNFFGRVAVGRESGQIVT